MLQATFIGTLHSGMTPKNELNEILERLNPSQLFVELSPEEAYERPKGDSIRDEMFFVLEWARSRSIPILCYDVENDTLRKGVTGKESELIELTNKLKKALRAYSWKDLNNQPPWQLPEVVAIEDEINQKFIDPLKEDERETEMLNNIKQNLTGERAVVLTGVGHLSFFKQHMPEAQFPLRNA